MRKQYRKARDYENIQHGMFPEAGEYGIPIIQPVTALPEVEWTGWNYARSLKGLQKDKGVHFFLDDYQFLCLWKRAPSYTGMLQKFGAVLSPDFSPYADFPKAIQVYNHYRKHWLAAYWQASGITVIPTITWSHPDTLEWFTDGEPEGGIVAVSSIGMLGPRFRQWHLDGFREMMRRLRPTQVLWMGEWMEELDEYKDKVIFMARFTERFKEHAGDDQDMS